MDEKALLKEFTYPIRLLFVPQLKRAYGFGHLRRVIQLVRDIRLKSQINVVCRIYIPKDSFDSIVRNLIAKYLDLSVCISDMSGESWSFIITDMYRSSTTFARNMNRMGVVIALDEGGAGKNYYAYLLDTLPRLLNSCSVNEQSTGYLSLPNKVRSQRDARDFPRILLSFGGSDQSRLTEVIGNFLDSYHYPSQYWSVVKGPFFNRTLAWPGVKIMENVDLLEVLKDYDIVFTHFGLTAYEALESGCKPILVNPTRYHQRLSIQEGFFSLGVKSITRRSKKWLEKNLKNITSDSFSDSLVTAKHTVERLSLSDRIVYLSQFRVECPICGKNGEIRKILYRDKSKSYAECALCDIWYLLCFEETNHHYDEIYFNENYRKQYGKSYLEDFFHIKQMALGRLTRSFYYLSQKKNNTVKLLDIGCAYGACLQAGVDMGLDVYGIDISKDAVNYVVHSLGLRAETASFPEDIPYQEERFHLLTMWYVIEHFTNLDTVMYQVNDYLELGGIFAFSTPKGDGLSARKNLTLFLRLSPIDHYTIFRKKNLKRFLDSYGFELLYVNITGIHVQRKFSKVKENSFLEKILKFIFKIMHWGDTFEIYARKKRNINRK